MTENITAGAGPTYTGSIDTSAARAYAIRGWVNTSHGRVETTVRGNVNFTNDQQFDVSPTTDIQNVEQMTAMDATSVTKEGWLTTEREQHFRYPLTIDFSFVVNADNSEDQTTTVHQEYDVHETTRLNGWPAFESDLHNAVHATDTLPFDASGAFLGPTGSKTSQTYTWKDSRGGCYSRTVVAEAQKLTRVDDGDGCHDRRR